jgi:hypothetical protein
MKFEYREQDYWREFEAPGLEEAIQYAEQTLRDGDWDIEPGDTLQAIVAELDDDGNQITTHPVSIQW